MEVTSIMSLIKYLFENQSYFYRGKPIINLADVLDKDIIFPFNNYTVGDWEFNGVDSFPYVCIVSENDMGDSYYNVRLLGRRNLVKLKKRLLKPEFRNLLNK